MTANNSVSWACTLYKTRWRVKIGQSLPGVIKLNNVNNLNTFCSPPLRALYLSQSTHTILGEGWKMLTESANDTFHAMYIIITRRNASNDTSKQPGKAVQVVLSITMHTFSARVEKDADAADADDRRPEPFNKSLGGVCLAVRVHRPAKIFHPGALASEPLCVDWGYETSVCTFIHSSFCGNVGENCFSITDGYQTRKICKNCYWLIASELLLKLNFVCAFWEWGGLCQCAHDSSL